MASPSLRQKQPSAQRGSCSPGYHLPWPKCSNGPLENRSASLRNSTPASRRFSGPSASVFHSAPSMSSTDTNVGSPPMVSFSPALAMSRSIASPTPTSFSHCSSE